jgi:predicted cupin superfamily sugar epimerase
MIDHARTGRPAGRACDLVAALDLAPHPEGGWYRETWRGAAGADGRAVGTAIYYLLEAGQVSHWHRVDTAEVWHWYAGAPLKLTLSADGTGRETHWLGPDIAAGQRPQAVVPPGCWQSARSGGDFTLVGCTVSPGFEFAGFEMAPEGWEPGRT